MTKEQLQRANEVFWAINDKKYHARLLEKAQVVIKTDSYDFSEEKLELMPEEQEALESLRQAYLTILRTANERKLKELSDELEKL